MKKIIKTNFKIMIAFVIGAIVFGSVGVVSAYTLLSNHIEYEPKDSAWKVNNVSDALDSLYIAKTGENYLTEERVVGTWIDGEPLYQKSLSFTIISGLNRVDIGTSNINEIVSIDAIGYGEERTTPIPSAYSNVASSDVSWYCGITILNKNTIFIESGSGFANANPNVYVTIQYTKTEQTQNAG